MYKETPRSYFIGKFRSIWEKNRYQFFLGTKYFLLLPGVEKV